MIDRIVRHFKRATRRIVVIGPYTSEQTVRMMAFGAGQVDLILVADRLSAATRQEAEDVISHGGRLSVFQRKDLHDRFFVVDETWHQSGGSLKDLGKRWSRISKVEAKEIRDHERMLRELASPATRVL